MNGFHLLLIGALMLLLCGCGGDWRTAERSSAGIAPDPQTTSEAVLQVYAADAWGWRGWFAVHTWIAVKPADENTYTVYEVVGWRQRNGRPVLRIEQDLPDRFWFGERPHLLVEHRGAAAEQLIGRVDAAARTYPWPKTYKAFPGPNSNTFTAWVAEQVPELQLDLPFSAFGSGYIDRHQVAAKTTAE